MPEKKTQQANPQLKTNQPERNQHILPFNAQLKANPLKTRDDVQQALVDILTPAMNLCLTCGRFASFRMSDSGALYNTERNQIEGFTCLLWGLGPLFADKTNIERYPTWWNYVTTSLLHGVDPNNPDYFGSTRHLSKLIRAFTLARLSLCWRSSGINKENILVAG